MTRLDRFRSHKDEFFRSDPHSPLLPEQQARFMGLRYYPEDPALRFEVGLDREAVAHEPVRLPTTTGEEQTVVPAGKLHVTIAGQPVSFVVYREPGRGRYFVPFRDSTAGTETYVLGRYLDPQGKPDGTLIVDFNYAYNPYCAYDDRWSCPIPPPENRVAVPIRAGEQTFALGAARENESGMRGRIGPRAEDALPDPGEMPGQEGEDEAAAGDAFGGTRGDGDHGNPARRGLGPRGERNGA